jgi:hypothetical protein
VCLNLHFVIVRVHVGCVCVFDRERESLIES